MSMHGAALNWSARIWSQRRGQHLTLRYGSALLAVAIATALRMAAGSWLSDPALLFFAAVSLIAWRAGAGPGYFAVALSAWAQARYFIAPDSYLIGTLQEAASLAMWFVEGVIVCTLFGSLRNATIRELLAKRELAAANDELRREGLRNELVLGQLRQGQKMEAIGRLAGGVAHDFNNLLTVIVALVGINLEENELTTNLRQDFEEIAKAAERATSLTRQLLTFSRQTAVLARVLNVRETLDDMSIMLQTLVGENVTFVPAASAPTGNVRIDPGSLGQVVMNLVVNARDAMPKGGSLTVEVADVALDSDYVHEHMDAKEGPHVMLTVSDTGTGMSKDTMAHLFEPFFTTKAKGKGTGLGLSTVFGAVKQAGGSIAVSSEEGVGTSFRIYLPRVESPVESKRPGLGFGNLRGLETILLVEDEDQVRAAAHAILSRYGYTVLDARDGDDALRVHALHSGVIDLVVSDVVMPRMGGPELAARLIKMRPDIKVLCMSGYTDDAVVGPKGLGPGIAFIQKPFEPKMLASKVREVLDAPPLPPASVGSLRGGDPQRGVSTPATGAR